MAGFIVHAVGGRLRADPVDQDERMSYVSLSERLYKEQYTGPVTLHFAQGYPVRAEIPSAPTRITLDRKG